MLLDNFLPKYDFYEFHQRRVQASTTEVFRAIKELTPEELPLMRLLMSIRLLPGRLAGQERAAPVSGDSVLREFIKDGFLLLAEEHDREILVGRIGQFWKPAGGEDAHVTDPDAFIAFDRPGFAKVAMNFRVETQTDSSANLSTETRIAATDASARGKFCLYWAVIYPGSALIRWEWLRAIALRAQRTAGHTPTDSQRPAD